MNEPKVSVVLTSFNHAQYLRQSIDSVLTQTFSDFELFIWDDSSTDDSWSIIQSYTDNRIKSFRNDQQRRGPYGLNKVINELSRADLIAIHHSDDIWEPNKLERQVAFLGNHSNIGAVFTNARAITDSGSDLENSNHFYSNIFNQPNRSRHEWLRHFFFRGNALCHPSILIRKECFQKCGAYRFGFAQLTDFEMWVRLCLQFEIHVLPEKLVRFRVRANEANASGDKPEARIRGTTENFILLENYANQASFEDMVTVFPEAGRYYRQNGFIPRFVLAMVALNEDTHAIAKAFGIIELFNLLKDPGQAAKIQSLYQFDYRDLIRITGSNDAFLSETLKTVNDQLTDYRKQLSDLQKRADEVSAWAQSLQNTIALRDNQIVDLQNRQNELSEWGGRLQETISLRDDIILSLQTKVNEVSVWAQTLNADLQIRNGDVERLNDRHQQISDTNQALNVQIISLSDQVSLLQQTLSTREKTISDLISRVTELSAEQKTMCALIVESEQKGTDLASKIIDLSAQVSAVTKDLSERNRMIEKLINDNEALSMQCRSELSRIEQKDLEIAELTLLINAKVEAQALLENSLSSSREEIKKQQQTIAEKTALTETYLERITIAEEKLTRQHRDLMELSHWASKIDHHPLQHGVRRIGSRLLRTLPSPISSSIRKLIRPHRSAAVKNSPRSNELSTPALAEAPTKSRTDIFIFSIIDWSFRTQRPQHIAQALAEQGNRVFFFSNHFIDAATAGYSINRIHTHLELYEIKLNVSGAPAIYFSPPTAIAEQMLSEGIQELMMDYGISGSISIIQHCYWFPIQRRIPDSYWIYDCMDHHEGFGNVPDSLVDIEKQLLSQADLITVTSSWLYDFASQYHDNVEIIRNGCEFDFFARKPEEIFVDKAKRKIIGYYGAIADWFDIELIEKIAITHPEALIILVGEDTVGARAALKHLPNIQFTGEIPYKQLPFYLYAFDVCLLPFKIMSLTLATNPVKVYEYLAASKPVIAVDLPEMAQFKEVVQTARDHDEFLKFISITLKSSLQASAQSQAFAAQQTWTHRAAQLCKSIEQLPLPKISVVVLTHNNLHLTQACIQSLIKNSNYPDLELIIVDNASSDDTPSYLRTIAAERPDIKLILNTDNRGFAAGNNQGLKIATGDYLVILNNDTKVTPGWALTMLRHLLIDSTIGIIGPITNNIGNEARVETSYQNHDEMISEARQLTLSKMGHSFPLRTVAFFCAMLPRHIYEKCGPLSEDFGLGFFEDDDYCRRIEALGYRVFCADDVFVHHELSASFNKLADSVRQELFQKNKAVYEEKWGAWVPHVYR